MSSSKGTPGNVEQAEATGSGAAEVAGEMYEEGDSVVLSSGEEAPRRVLETPHSFRGTEKRMREAFGPGPRPRSWIGRRTFNTS